MEFGDVDWSQAACKGKGPSIFYSFKKRDIEEARAICLSCPIIEDCLEWSVNEEFGMWGSRTSHERDEDTTIDRSL